MCSLSFSLPPLSLSLSVSTTNKCIININMIIMFISDLTQWGAADAEIKGSFVQNPDLKSSPFSAWRRSVYSHACYACCQGFSFVISTLPVHSPAFFPQNLSRVFPVLAVANTGSCVGPQNKISHPVHHFRQLVQVPVLCASGILGSNIYVIVLLGLRSKIVDMI